MTRNLLQRRPHDLWFRLGTGGFALLLIAIVVAIGVELLQRARERGVGTDV